MGETDLWGCLIWTGPCWPLSGTPGVEVPSVLMLVEIQNWNRWALVFSGKFWEAAVRCVPLWEGWTSLKLTLYALLNFFKNYSLGRVCQGYICSLTLLLYFVLFPVIETFILCGREKFLEHYIFVCLSILRIAEWLVWDRVESCLVHELDILVSDPGLSLVGRFAVMGFIKLIVVTVLWSKYACLHWSPRLTVLPLCFVLNN